MTAETGPERLCIYCGAHDPVLDGESVWPIGWHCPACRRSLAEQDGMPLLAPELADTDIGFDSTNFANLAEMETRHFWFIGRNELFVGLANRFFPDAKCYLEIGCGTGAVMRSLARTRHWSVFVGSDLHPTGLKLARARLPQGTQLVQLDARAIPAANTFDLIGAFDVLEHVDDDHAALQSLHEAIVPGGGAIISVPQHPILWSRADEILHHQRRYRMGELEAKLRSSGFDVVFSTSYVVALLPAMALSRLASRFMADDRGAEREAMPGPTTNAILTRISKLEVYLTLAGLRWPIGGSRVVVARALK